MTENSNTAIINQSDFEKYQKNGVLVFMQMKSFDFPWTDMMRGYKVSKTYIVLENVGYDVVANYEPRELIVDVKNAKKVYDSAWKNIEHNLKYVSNPYIINSAVFKDIENNGREINLRYKIVKPFDYNGKPEFIKPVDCVDMRLATNQKRDFKIIPVQEYSGPISYQGDKIKLLEVQTDIEFRNHEDARNFYKEMIILGCMSRYYAKYLEWVNLRQITKQKGE